MDKIKEKISQAVYGTLIGGLAGVGLLFMAKEKTVQKLKQTMTLVKSKKS
jgi:hypothetical protein